MDQKNTADYEENPKATQSPRTSKDNQQKKKRRYGTARAPQSEDCLLSGIPSKEGPNNILRNAGSKLGTTYYQREIEELQRQIRNYKLYYCFVAAYNALSRLFLVEIQFIALSDYNKTSQGFFSWYMWYVIAGYSLPVILKPVFAWYSERFFPFRYRIKGYALVISILNIFIMSVVHFSSEVYVFEIVMQVSSISVLMLDAIAQGMTTTTIAMEKRLLQKLHPFTPIRRRKYLHEKLQVVETTSARLMDSSSKLRRELPINAEPKAGQLCEEFLSNDHSSQQNSDISANKQGFFLWEPSHTSNYAQYLSVFHLFAYIFTFASYWLLIYILKNNPQHKPCMKDFQKFTPALYISISFSTVLLLCSLCFRELRREGWVEKNPPSIDLRLIARSLFTGQQAFLVWLVGVICANPLNFMFAKVMFESFSVLHNGEEIGDMLTLTLPILLSGIAVSSILLMMRNSLRFSGVAVYGGLMIVMQGVALLLMFVFSLHREFEYLRSRSMIGIYLLASGIIMEGIGGLGKLCLVERFSPGAPKGYSVLLVNLISAIVTLGLWFARILIFAQSAYLFDDSETGQGLFEALGIDTLIWIFCILLLFLYNKKHANLGRSRKASEIAYDWKVIKEGNSTTASEDDSKASKERMSQDSNQHEPYAELPRDST